MILTDFVWRKRSRRENPQLLESEESFSFFLRFVSHFLIPIIVYHFLSLNTISTFLLLSILFQFNCSKQIFPFSLRFKSYFFLLPTINLDFDSIICRFPSCCITCFKYLPDVPIVARSATERLLEVRRGGSNFSNCLFVISAPSCHVSFFNKKTLHSHSIRLFLVECFLFASRIFPFPSRYKQGSGIVECFSFRSFALIAPWLKLQA